MTYRSRAPSDIFAWALLCCGLVLTACLLSHDPSSPVPAEAYPTTELPDNLLGAPGGWLAQELFQALGLAVYLFLAGWLVLALLLLARRPALVWCVRLLGWLVLVPAAAAFADRLDLVETSPALGGAGGSLGAWVNGALAEQFAETEQALVLGAALLLGILLTMNTLLLGGCRLFVRILRPRRNAASGESNRPKRVPARKKAAARAPRPEPAAPLEPKKSAKVASSDPAIPIHYVAPAQDSEAAAKNPEPVQSPAADGTAIPIVRPSPAAAEEEPTTYELPPLSLLEEAEPFPFAQHDQLLRERAVLLEKTFRDFELNVRVVGINTGPVITQFEVALETGLRLHKVTRLADDIALNLKVSSVRMVAPIPGKNTVGVEIPNEHRAIVRLKEVILTAGKTAARMKIPLFLGKDAEGRPLLYDLAEMPHLLIAGRTGTGKSVCLNSIIISMLMTRRPDEVKMLMIDPKRAEMSEYGQIPHLMHPVVTDMKKAEAILSWAVDEMEKRYDLLSQARVRSSAAYNQLTREEQLRRINPPAEEQDHVPERMPYIVIIVDEMADLMMTMKREVEGHIIRLAQKSRAAGIHLVVATQKPTVDVITGLIKSNLPARICFQVSSRTDSRVVLDEMGADKLLGKGDMLFLQPGTSTLARAQGTYASDSEITRVVEALEGEPEFAEELLQLGSTNAANGDGSLHERLRARDDLYEQAIEIVVREGRGSVSLLQRALGIGYGRAARLIDFMAEDGFVGTYRGSNAREVLLSPEKWDQLKQGDATVSG
jgi:S-DNA-T family DNA segregation ATPase FtsK/SpoIIIE